MLPKLLLLLFFFFSPVFGTVVGINESKVPYWVASVNSGRLEIHLGDATALGKVLYDMQKYYYNKILSAAVK